MPRKQRRKRCSECEELFHDDEIQPKYTVDDENYEKYLNNEDFEKVRCVGEFICIWCVDF